MIVLVTGASGFVGRMLCGVLSQAGYQVRAAVRKERPSPGMCVHETALIGDIDSGTKWDTALAGVGAVIHTAARVHVMRDASQSRNLYTETNALGTKRLATEAARFGVRRFIYLSSVKVNGEVTSGTPFTAEDEPRPHDDYARSKWYGERHLLDIAAGAGMQAAIVRSPLVYGPGVRANFLRLLHWVHWGLPLPFGAVNNCRSMVSVWNLCDLLSNLLSAQLGSARHPWMVSDGEDLSTPDLIGRLGRSLHRKARLVAVPLSSLRILGLATGRMVEIQRLCDSLVVDVTRTKSELAWTPPMSVDEALAKTAYWYLREGGTRAS